MLPIKADDMSEIIELTTTTDTPATAEELARLLVQSRLAACVQITGPIHSIYRWQGEICTAAEYRCTVKSLRRMTEQLIQLVLRHHPYDTPEILVTTVSECSEGYANWLEEQLEQTEG